MLEWLERLFLETTDPDTPYSRLLRTDVLSSIFLHAILYTILVQLVCVTLQIKCSRTLFVRITAALLVLLTFGYIARLCRVKCLANVIGSQKDAADTLRNAYYTWYFLG